jgi:PAS domain S-box-containing protein
VTKRVVKNGSRGKATPRRTARPLELSDPIITMNASGVIQSASDSVENLFGWTPLELLGRNISVLIPEPRRPALDRYLDRYRDPERGASLTRSRRFSAIRKDGSAIRIELSMSRASLPQHVAPFFIGIIRDVSREMAPDLSSAEQRSRLQQLVTEQTRALATANLRLHLADRLAALGTLAAGLGHDMNNVLLPVRARLNAMEHAGITGAAQHHLGAIRASIAYLQHLSDALHFLAADPDSTWMEDDGEGATDLHEWWVQVGSLLRKAIPRHVKLRVDIPKGLPVARIHPHWLTQAMLNLIVNAGEAIPVGRRTGAVRIVASQTSATDPIRLSVIDNGRGMSPATQRRAFDFFFTTKSRSMGTGLGLPLARRVAHRAGGEVEIQSDERRGTTVTLVLRTAAGDALPGAQAHQPLRAVISIRSRPTTALVAKALASLGVQSASRRPTTTAIADLWITDATAAAVGPARRWQLKHPGGTVVTVGHRSLRTTGQWIDLGAAEVDTASNIAGFRAAVRTALASRDRHQAKGT